jgi:hypothetical protein
MVSQNDNLKNHYCSSNDEMDFDLGPSNEDREGIDDEANNDDNC